MAGLEQRIVATASPVSLPFSSPLPAGHHADAGRPRNRSRVKVSDDSRSHLMHPLTASRHVFVASPASPSSGSGHVSSGLPAGGEHPAEEKRSVRAHAQTAGGEAAGESAAAGETGAAAKGSADQLMTLPTMLTLARVVAVPAIIPAFFFAPGVATGIFIAASITDWLDGYLARKMNLSSAFGAFLDPVADKLMVAAVLVLLCTEAPPAVAFGLAVPAWAVALPSIAIIGREIAMSAVREWAAGEGDKLREVVAVSGYGKWKTATQMIAITVLLAVRMQSLQVASMTPLLATAGMACLYTSAVLAVTSFAIYLRSIARFLSL